MNGKIYLYPGQYKSIENKYINGVYASHTNDNKYIFVKDIGLPKIVSSMRGGSLEPKLHGFLFFLRNYERKPSIIWDEAETSNGIRFVYFLRENKNFMQLPNNVFIAAPYDEFDSAVRKNVIVRSGVYDNERFNIPILHHKEYIPDIVIKHLPPTPDPKRQNDKYNKYFAAPPGDPSEVPIMAPPAAVIPRPMPPTRPMPPAAPPMQPPFVKPPPVPPVPPYVPPNVPPYARPIPTGNPTGVIPRPMHPPFVPPPPMRVDASTYKSPPIRFDMSTITTPSLGRKSPKRDSSKTPSRHTSRNASPKRDSTNTIVSISSDDDDESSDESIAESSDGIEFTESVIPEARPRSNKQNFNEKIFDPNTYAQPGKPVPGKPVLEPTIPQTVPIRMVKKNGSVQEYNVYTKSLPALKQHAKRATNSHPKSPSRQSTDGNRDRLVSFGKSFYIEGTPKTSGNIDDPTFIYEPMEVIKSTDQQQDETAKIMANNRFYQRKYHKE